MEYSLHFCLVQIEETRVGLVSIVYLQTVLTCLQTIQVYRQTFSVAEVEWPL